MSIVPTYQRLAGPCDRLLFGRPDLWFFRPFLPVFRYPVEAPIQAGVMYDAIGAADLYGYSTTVFLLSIFELPALKSNLLTQPRIVYDTIDELAHDGWLID